jgi:hypothetical protein
LNSEQPSLELFDYRDPIVNSELTKRGQIIIKQLMTQVEVDESALKDTRLTHLALFKGLVSDEYNVCIGAYRCHNGHKHLNVELEFGGRQAEPSFTVTDKMVELARKITVGGQIHKKKNFFYG